MLEGLYAAASGMEAQQQQLDAIGNDLANASTTGYKAERVGFRDLLYNQVDLAGTTTTQGAGAAAQTIGRNQAQGSIQSTGNPLDVAIEGPGFFTVKRPNGTVALTRDGSLAGQRPGAAHHRRRQPARSADHAAPGRLAQRSRDRLRRHRERRDQDDRQALTRHRRLARPPARRRRQPVLGDRRLRSPPADLPAPPSKQGALEGSNVDVGNDMVQMMGAQRSYQLESSAIQTENQMLSIANQLVTS